MTRLTKLGILFLALWLCVPPGVFAATTAAPLTCNPDVNRDGLVNLLDLVAVAVRYAAGWRSALPAGTPADTDGDGQIGLSDLACVSSHLGRTVVSLGLPSPTPSRTATLGVRLPTRTPGPTATPVCWERATVDWAKGYDGDSFDVWIDGRADQVRLIGVDAPEWYMYWGSEAKSALRALIGEASICLEKDVQVSNRDEYDRLLRYVWAGDRLVNAELLQQGSAWVYTYERNARHLVWFLELEREAKAARRGLWGAEPSTTDECPFGCTDHKAGCDIKGNISEDGQKIYHMPGQQYYDNTRIDPAKGERWFCSEEAALANGWRKSKR